MSNGACLECNCVHPADAAIAVGRFSHDGPSGFIANVAHGASLRNTRIEAVADYCAQQRKDYSENPGLPKQEAAGHEQ